MQLHLQLESRCQWMADIWRNSRQFISAFTCTSVFGGSNHDSSSQSPGSRPRQSRLARYVPHVFIFDLPRPQPHAVSVAASHERRHRGSGARIWYSSAQRHGDRHLRARRSVGTQRLDGERRSAATRRVSANVGRNRDHAQRIQSV